MPSTSESRLIAAPSRVVILSGVQALSGHDDSREESGKGATLPFSQTNYRQMLTPSTPPSFHPARPACQQAGSA
jgi:hypothetical protein